MPLLTDIGPKLDGEHALFTEYAKLIPLLEKHFKGFDGQRATIANGDRSAKFARACSEFTKEAREVSTARVIIASRNSMSASLQMDITRPSKNGEGCVYYNHSAPVGEIDAYSYGNPDTVIGTFHYTFKREEAEQHCDKILAVTPEQLERAKEKIEDLEEAIRQQRIAIPYEFHDCIQAKR